MHSFMFLFQFLLLTPLALLNVKAKALWTFVSIRVIRPLTIGIKIRVIYLAAC